jgi:hypothetical protein
MKAPSLEGNDSRYLISFSFSVFKGLDQVYILTSKHSFYYSFPHRVIRVTSSFLMLTVSACNTLTPSPCYSHSLPPLILTLHGLSTAMDRERIITCTYCKSLVGGAGCRERVEKINITLSFRPTPTAGSFKPLNCPNPSNSRVE